MPRKDDSSWPDLVSLKRSAARPILEGGPAGGQAGVNVEAGEERGVRRAGDRERQICFGTRENTLLKLFFLLP